MSKVKDKATAFKNEIAGSQTNKIVCKASSHEVAGPKKKHVDYLLQLVNHPRCQFSTLVDLLAERLKHTNWVVVYKALIVTHNLMSLGNEKFLQSVATRIHIFDLDGFSDRTDILSGEMSSYLRKYARYVKLLCIAYKTLAVDICRLPSGESSPFKNMEIAKVLKFVSVIQDQLDLLLEVEFASQELSNGVINTSFLMLYKDLIKIYTVYNDALINLLEKFFEMKKSECKETIGVYRRFLLRQESVQRFLQLAEDVGVDKETHLNLRQVPEDLLPALENHISEIDATKKASGSQPSPQIQAASERLQKLREQDLRKNASPNQSGSGVVSGYPSASADVLDAQRKRFEELKKRASEVRMSPERSSETSTSAKPATTTTTPSGSSDLLGLSDSSTKAATFDPWASSPATTQQAPPATSNPFQTPPTNAAPATANSSNPWGTPQAIASDGAGTADPWGGGQANNVASSYQEVDLFSEIRGPDFNTVFGGSNPAPPASSRTTSAGTGISLTQYTMGDILTPQAVGQHASVSQEKQRQQQQTGLTTDVDSSLAAAAANLSVDVGNTRIGMTKKKDHQWTAKKESVKTGGPNWQKQNLQPSTLQQPLQQPMQQPMGKAANWSGGLQAGHFPVNPVQAQPVMMGQPTGMGMGMQPMGMGMQPMGMGMGMQQPMMQQPMMQQPMMMQQPRPFMQQPIGMQQQQPNMWGQQQQNPFGQNAPLL